MDAGVVELASIGDRVFLDTDGDGIQDTEESGVSGVIVILTGGGADGDINTTGDNTTVTATTNASGNYSDEIAAQFKAGIEKFKSTQTW